MTTSAELAIVLTAKDMASGVLKKTADEIGNVGSAAKKSGDLFSGFLGGFAKVGLAATGVMALGGAIGGLAKGMVAGNAEFERYETQFGVLLGSVDKAKERIGQLSKFAATTPFELPEVVKAGKVLETFGLQGDRAMKRFGMSTENVLQVVGDAAAGSGAKFDELALTFGKFSSGATGEAIARMQELGLTTREELASMGVKFSKSGELISDKEKALAIVFETINKRFGGMMQKQSMTFEGMLSNLSDWISQTKRKLMAPLFEVLKDKLGVFLEFLNSPAAIAALDNFAAGLAKGMGTAIDVISKVGKAVADMVGIVTGRAPEAGGALRAAIGDKAAEIIAKALATIREAVQTTVDTLKVIVDKTKEFGQWLSGGSLGADAFAVSVLAVGVAVGTIQTVQAVEALKALTGAVKIATLAHWAQATAAWASIAPLLPFAIAIGVAVAAVVFIGTHLDELSQAFDALTGIVGVLLSGAWAALVSAWEGFVGMVSGMAAAVTGEIGSLFSRIGTTIRGFVTVAENLWREFSERPLYWVGRLIGGVAANLLNLAQNIGDFAGKALFTVTTWIKDTAKTVGDFFTELPGKIGGWLGSAFSAIGTFTSNAINAVGSWLVTTWQKISTFFVALPIDIGTWLSTIPAKFGELATNIGTALNEFFTALPKRFSDLGNAIVTGFRDGIIGMRDWLTKQIGDFFGGIVDSVKAGLGIKSPSTVMAAVGNDVVDGFILGIQERKGASLAAVADWMTLLQRELVLAQTMVGTIGKHFAPGADAATQRKIGTTQLINQATNGAGSVSAAQLANGPRFIHIDPKTGNPIPIFHQGGVMGHDGLAQLQKGERIIPAGDRGGAGGGITINISGDVVGLTKTELANELGRIYFGRMVGSGATIS